ncbi:hypothetical protein ACOQFL_22865, partial [Actinopolyspora sp. H202]|uniref:hypothetical protein n=1 Tax=Actinopolyspora sp. H202 TaxID=1500456 RepID=UPI003EE4FF1F
VKPDRCAHQHLSRAGRSAKKIAEKDKGDNAKIPKQERTEALPLGQCVRQGLRPWNPESALRKALAKSQETATTTKQGNNNKNKGEHRMAIYHSRVTTFSRANNHSSLAAAAYRAAILLVDQRTGKRHDYRRK